MKEFESMYKVDNVDNTADNIKNNDNTYQNMDFISLYTKLYNENFEELEELRKKERNVGIVIFAIVFATIICTFIAPFLAPLFIIAFVIFIIITLINSFNKSKNNLVKIKDKNSIKIVYQKSYKGLFKEKIITPIIQNQFPLSKYIWYRGIDRSEYRRAEWESFDLFDSEDQIITPINIPNFEEYKSELVISEVHTQNESRDSDGDTHRTTLFHGLAGQVNLPKDIGCYIKVTRDKLKLFGGSKDKLDMDMSEFEKIFDVETDDKIKAMQILTADVMTDMINMIQTSKVKFEFYINYNKMYIRFHTGELFEPSAFGKSMQFDMLKRYCDITKGTIKTVEDICNKVMSMEL